MCYTILNTEKQGVSQRVPREEEMSQIIEIREYVENAGVMASHEVWDAVADLIEQFRNAGFSEDDIQEGIEFALEEEF